MQLLEFLCATTAAHLPQLYQRRSTDEVERLIRLLGAEALGAALTPETCTPLLDRLTEIAGLNDHVRHLQDEIKILAEVCLAAGCGAEVVETSEETDERYDEGSEDGDAAGVLSCIYSIAARQLEAGGQTIAKWSRCGCSSYGDPDNPNTPGGGWSTEEDTDGGDSLPRMVEAILEAFGLEDLDLPCAPEPAAPEECPRAEATACVRHRNSACNDRDWSVIEYYSTIEEAREAAAAHQRGFRAACRNGYGPEWEACDLDQARVDTSADMKERMAALLSPGCPIAPIDPVGNTAMVFHHEPRQPKPKQRPIPRTHRRRG